MSALDVVADDTRNSKVGCDDPQCGCESPFWDDPRACYACGRVTELTRIRINLPGGPALFPRCFEGCDD